MASFSTDRRHLGIGELSLKLGPQNFKLDHLGVDPGCPLSAYGQLFTIAPFGHKI
jgi:hypothetical protein